MYVCVVIPETHHGGNVSDAAILHGGNVSDAKFPAILHGGNVSETIKKQSKIVQKYLMRQRPEIPQGSLAKNLSDKSILWPTMPAVYRPRAIPSRTKWTVLSPPIRTRVRTGICGNRRPVTSAPGGKEIVERHPRKKDLPSHHSSSAESHLPRRK